jgi:hypothetical protein
MATFYKYRQERLKSVKPLLKQNSNKELLQEDEIR